MKKVIYSVITGGYDNLLVAPQFKGWDVIMFTDRDFEDSKGWEIRKLPKSQNPLIQSRDIKILSHIHLPEYDLVCYTDGNQKIIKEPPSQPVWFLHDKRPSIFVEGKQIIINGRFPADKINEQIDYYNAQGYKDCGLYLNGFFVRDHSPEINKLHEEWFKETCRFTPRDQLSLPYTIWKTGITPKNLYSAKHKGQWAIVTQAHTQLYETKNPSHYSGSLG